MLQWAVFESACRARWPPATTARPSSGSTQPSTSAGAAATRPTSRSSSPTRAGCTGWPAACDDALGEGRRAAELADRHRHTWWSTTAAALYAGTLLAAGEPGRRRPPCSGRPCAWPTSPAPRPTCCAASARWPRRPATRPSWSGPTRCCGAIRAPEGSAWLLGADAYLCVARAWRRAGRPRPGRGDPGRLPRRRRRGTRLDRDWPSSPADGRLQGCCNGPRHRPPRSTTHDARRPAMAIDNDKLMEFLGRFVGDLGATIAAGNVVVGHRLGLYRALGEAPGDGGPARRAHRHPPALHRRVAARPGGRRLRRAVRRPVTRRPTRSPRSRRLPDQPRQPGLRPGRLPVRARARCKAEPRITEAVRTGGGVGWHEHDPDVFVGCEQFFRPGYLGNLTRWIRRLDGVEEKLRARRRGRRRRLRPRAPRAC